MTSVFQFTYRLMLLGIFGSILIYQPNVFPWAIYVGILLSYLLIKVVLTHSRHSQYWNIFLDYLLIAFALYGKDISCPINMILLILPMIGGIYNIYWLRRVELCVLLTCGVAYIIGGRQLFSQILGISVILGILVAISNFKEKWRVFSQRLMEKVDEYFTNRDITKKPYQVYDSIIKDLNKQIHEKAFYNISAYVVKQDRTSLINSSEYQHDKSLDSNIDVKTIIANADAKIYRIKDDKLLLIYPILLEDRHYLITYETSDSPIMSVYLKAGLKNILRGLSGRIANLLDFTFRMKMETGRVVQANRVHKEYIDKAISVMHFLRNSLSPFANLLEYEKLPVIQKRMLPRGEIDKLIKAAHQDYDQIINYANALLDRDKYPFTDPEIHPIDVADVISYLQVACEYTVDCDIEYTIDDISDMGKTVVCNDDDLRVLFTDWLNNMKKYGENHEVMVNVTATEMSITFQNSVIRSNDRDIEDIVTLINNDEKNISLNRKRTFGISNMKETTKKYSFSMKSFLETVDNKQIIILKIGLPLHDREKNITD